MRRAFVMTTNFTTAEDDLAKLGIKLPAPPEPFGTYVGGSGANRE